VHRSISQMKHQLDATLCRFYFCRVTLWLCLALIRRCDDLPATITHVPVATISVLNTPDDGRLRPKHVEWLCRNKICTVLHQVGVSFDHNIKLTTLMPDRQRSELNLQDDKTFFNKWV